MEEKELGKCVFELDKTIPVGVSKIEYYTTLVKKIISTIKENFKNREKLKIYMEGSVLPILQMNSQNLFKTEFNNETSGTYKAGELKLDEENYVDVYVSSTIIEKGKINIEESNSHKFIFGYVIDKALKEKKREKITLELTRHSIDIIIEALEEYAHKYTSQAYNSVKTDTNSYYADDNNLPDFLKTLSKGNNASEIIDVIKYKLEEK